MDLYQDVDGASCAGTELRRGLEGRAYDPFRSTARPRNLCYHSEKVDFDRPAKEVDPFIASREKLRGVTVYARSFPGWESFGALVSHLKFVADHHRKIERIAAVSDIMPRIADHFVQAEIKHFDLAQKDQALAWLESGQ